MPPDVINLVTPTALTNDTDVLTDEIQNSIRQKSAVTVPCEDCVDGEVVDLVWGVCERRPDP